MALLLIIEWAPGDSRLGYNVALFTKRPVISPAKQKVIVSLLVTFNPTYS